MVHVGYYYEPEAVGEGLTISETYFGRDTEFVLIIDKSDHDFPLFDCNIVDNEADDSWETTVEKVTDEDSPPYFMLSADGIDFRLPARNVNEAKSLADFLYTKYKELEVEQDQ